LGPTRHGSKEIKLVGTHLADSNDLVF
jgi:hypothetical protein